MAALPYYYATFTKSQSNTINNLATAQSSNSGSSCYNLESEVQSLENEVQTLQGEVQNYQNIVNLQNSDTLWQNYPAQEGPGGSFEFYFTANYAGYVIVDVVSSSTSNTWVQIEINNPSTGTIESQQYTVGYSGTVYFPVLPGTVYIYIGNSNLINGASQTVTITYVY
uniref:Uncharacterized protein n=1 Tax=Sulfolobus neozealandicus TaxID=299422 RepID=Q5NDZ6_9CREN|nr:hypothetical protein [Sulfolobus neozealandicus]CAH89331.1 hypothetical protein [Sulfolobus neozealandicus]